MDLMQLICWYLHVFPSLRAYLNSLVYLLGVLNVYGAITAVPYIVLKCLNANVVRNISGPLLTGAAAAAPA